VGAEACFNADNAARQLLELSLKRRALDLAAQDDSALAVKPHQVENFLADIEADRRQRGGLRLCHGFSSL
jgi:hypothetical protein